MFNTNELSGQQATTINGQPYTITTRYSLSGTPVNQSVAYMVERLQRLGLAVTTHTWNARRPPNVIAEKPGLNPSAGIFIICAPPGRHAQSGLAPGADDNGSGSIALLHAAESSRPTILTPPCASSCSPVKSRGFSAARRTPPWCRARISAACSTWT